MVSPIALAVLRLITSSYKKLLIEGVRPNGVPVAHQMPYPFYKILTPGDLEAVAAYVKSVPAMHKSGAAAGL